MPEERDEARGEELLLLTSSRDLDDYDILETQTLSVAVPYKTTESYRKLIWAAMATYGFLWDHRKDKGFERDPRILALRDVVMVVGEVANGLDRVEVPSTGVGPICSKAALCRLEASFKAAYGLVRKEYIFETDAVVRLILEQLAWAYAVKTIADDQVFKLPTTKCISRLKAIWPSCGLLYCELTESAHIDPSIAKNYLKFHKEGIDVVRRSEFNSRESGRHLITLGFVYLKVTQQLFAPLEPPKYKAATSRMQHAEQLYAANITS